MSEETERARDAKVEHGDRKRAAEDEHADRMKDAKREQHERERATTHEHEERERDAAKTEGVKQAELLRNAEHRADLREKART